MRVSLEFSVRPNREKDGGGSIKSIYKMRNMLGRICTLRKIVKKRQIKYVSRQVKSENGKKEQTS